MACESKPLTDQYKIYVTAKKLSHGGRGCKIKVGDQFALEGPFIKHIKGEICATALAGMLPAICYMRAGAILGPSSWCETSETCELTCPDNAGGWIFEVRRGEKLPRSERSEEDRKADYKKFHKYQEVLEKDKSLPTYRGSDKT